VAETLDSVLAQTYRDFETILINDGSPDTAELERVLKPYLTRINYIVKLNGGPSSARNAGIGAARGELIAFVDSDDLWTPEYLAFQVAQLDANPSADLVYPNAMCFRDGQKWQRLGRPMSAPMPEVTFTTLVTEECAAVSSLTARKAALERAGLFDEQLWRAEDFDLWLRCVKTGSRIIYHREPLVRYRIRGGSLSSDAVRMAAGAARVLRKMQATVEMTADERAAVERKIRDFEGQQLFHEGKQAFFAGDYGTATGKLQQANQLLRSGRISRLLLLLRTAPGLARMTYGWLYPDRMKG
jgi:glycosyltransferase involved in cell wall biosynthesis